MTLDARGDEEGIMMKRSVKREARRRSVTFAGDSPSKGGSFRVVSLCFAVLWLLLSSSSGVFGICLNTV